MNFFNMDITPEETERIRKRFSDIMEEKQFILGPEVRQLEEELSEYTGARHCVSCASGTDALILSLLAIGIKPNDRVLTPSFTFAATAEAIAFIGAVPVFVDVDQATFTIDPQEVERIIPSTNPKAIIGVDIFGLPCNWLALREISLRHNIRLIADSAQSFGASIHSHKVGTLADITCTSFFPTKPLACFGDGGAAFTDNAKYAIALKSLRAHGTSGKKYYHDKIGVNSRLDTLQAAVLLERLKRVNSERGCRNLIVSYYKTHLAEINGIRFQQAPGGYRSANAIFSFLCINRDNIKKELDAAGVPAQIYYPQPLHTQEAYKSFYSEELSGPMSVTNWLCDHILSIPAHSGMTAECLNKFITTLLTIFRR